MMTLGFANFWTIVQLSSAPAAGFAFTISLTSPNGTNYGGTSEQWPAGQTEQSFTMEWPGNSATTAFQDPGVGSGAWTVQFNLPQSQTCGVNFILAP